MKAKIAQVSPYMSYITGGLGIISLVICFISAMTAGRGFFATETMRIAFLVYMTLGVVLVRVCFKISRKIAFKAVSANIVMVAGMFISVYGLYRILRFIWFYRGYCASAMYWADLVLFFAGSITVISVAKKMFKKLDEEKRREKDRQAAELLGGKRAEVKEKCFLLLSADPSLSMAALAVNSGAEQAFQGGQVEIVRSFVKELVQESRFPGMFFNPETDCLAYLNTKGRGLPADGMETVQCGSCGATNRIKVGTDAACEYCGSKLKQTKLEGLK